MVELELKTDFNGKQRSDITHPMCPALTLIPWIANSEALA
jgi:hypothetical protein